VRIAVWIAACVVVFGAIAAWWIERSKRLGGQAPGPFPEEPLIRARAAFKSAISAYPLKTSSCVGEAIDLALSAHVDRGRDPTLVEIEVVDARTEVVVKRTAASGRIPRSECESFFGSGCGFRGRARLPTEEMVPGPYFLTLIDDEGARSDPVFILLRPSASEIESAAVAVVYPTATWQAYNQIGGGSFYTPNISRLYEISNQRPVPHAGHHSAAATIPFVRRLDALGVSHYGLTSEDLHREYALIEHAKIVLLTGHDEYWTTQVRDHLERYVDSGGRLVIFSGNVGWWTVSRADDRIFVNKGGRRDLAQYRGTGLSSGGNVRRPEEKLTGMSYRFASYPLKRGATKEAAIAAGVSESDYALSTGMIVLDEEHAIFDGTGLKKGDHFGVESELVAIELDGVPLTPAGEIDRTSAPVLPDGLRVLAQVHSFNPHRSGREIGVAGSIAEFRMKSGGHVMHFGSIGWFQALAKADPHATKIFDNTIRYVLGLDRRDRQDASPRAP
jgi:hypothetical protein